MRVIPAAALTGQAAGLAAALSLRNGSMPSDLNYEILAKALRAISVPLHFDDWKLTVHECLSNTVFRIRNVFVSGFVI